MDAYPLGMDPCTKIHDGRKLIGIRILSGEQHRVQFPNEGVELSLKVDEFFGNFGRIHAVAEANAHLGFFEARLASKRANKTRVRHAEFLHEERVPVFRGGDGWIIPPLSGENNFIENLAKVLA